MQLSHATNLRYILFWRRIECAGAWAPYLFFGCFFSEEPSPRGSPLPVPWGPGVRGGSQIFRRPTPGSQGTKANNLYVSIPFAWYKWGHQHQWEMADYKNDGKDVTESPRVTSRKSGLTLPAHYNASNQVASAENIAIFQAALCGSVHGVRTAIAKGGRVNYFHRPDDQKNSLHVASENGFLEVVELLMDNGADVECIVGSTKDTALLLACQGGHLEVVTLLIRRGADVLASNCFGNTPLHVSARVGSADLCNLLIGEGAVVDAVNNKWSTPLHFLCYATAPKSIAIVVARLLIDAGTYVDCKDARGCTPLLIAASNDKVDLLHFFFKEGADSSLCNDFGQDGLDIGHFHNHAAVVSFFQSLGGGNGK